MPSFPGNSSSFGNEKNESKRLQKTAEVKSSNVQFKQSFPQRAITSHSFAKPLSMNTTPVNGPIPATNFYAQRRYSGATIKIDEHLNPANRVPVTASMNDLSSVGLMVSSMTLHQRPSSRNRSPAKDASSAMNSRNNSRAGTPNRRRSSATAINGSSRRDSRGEPIGGGGKAFWSGNEEFYFPNGTEDDFREEEMEWINQAAAIDEKFFLKATAPPKVQVVLKRTDRSAS